MSACLSLLYASTELDCLFRQSCRILQADVVVEEVAALKILLYFMRFHIQAFNCKNLEGHPLR